MESRPNRYTYKTTPQCILAGSLISAQLDFLCLVHIGLYTVHIGLYTPISISQQEQQQ